MALNRLDHATLRVGDLGAACAWYGDGLGLDVLSRDATRADLGVADDHVDLTLVTGGAGLESFAFGVDDGAQLSSYVERLASAGVATEHSSDPRPGVSEGVSFQLPSGHRMEIQTGTADRQAGRHNESWDGSSCAPLDLDHINLVTADVAGLMEFFESTLDIRPTYIFPTPDGGLFGVWSRSSDYHHDVAFISVPGFDDAFHHLAFKVDGIRHMEIVADSLADLGHDLEFGPGRHPEINLFTYMLDPAGNRIELSAEMPLIPSGQPPVNLAPDTRMNAWSPSVPESFLTEAT